MAGGEGADAVRRLGPELHRTAVLLTGDADAATDLVARVLGRHDATSSDLEALRGDLARTYARRTRRSREIQVPGRKDDPAEALRGLSPRARAATVLRVAHGWDAQQTARALRIGTGTVDRLVPAVPDLDRALTGIADQHERPAGEVVRDLIPLLDRSTTTAPAGPSLLRHRRRALLAAALVVVGLGGYALTRDDPRPTPDEPATVLPGPTRDLGEAGMRLDDQGHPPWVAMGLRRLGSVESDPTSRQGQARLSSPTSPLQLAWFAALWCDMPPLDDTRIQPPEGTVTIGGEEVVVPCAGKDGDPAVSELVPLPPKPELELRVTGDLPPGGTAVLAVYAELDGPPPTLRTSGARAVLPDPPPGAVLVDEDDTTPTTDGVEYTQVVEITHDSTLLAQVEQPGTVVVLVDGTTVSDDGDLAWWEQLTASEEWGQAHPPGAWRTQRADLLMGRWAAYVAGDTRTFALPEGIRPAPGERRTVTVAVAAEQAATGARVTVTAATKVDVDTGPVPRRDPREGEAPEFVQGYRLVGVWGVPRDGLPRELAGLDLSDVESDGRPVAAFAVDDAPRPPGTWGWEGGQLLAQGATRPIAVDHDLTYLADAATALDGGWYPWDGPLAGPTTGVAALLSPSPGHPERPVYVYAPVDYADFDFTDAPPSGASWPEGGQPPLTHSSPGEVEVVLTEADVRDGTITYELREGSSEVLPRITTRGPGRLRLQLGDEPFPSLWGSDGWWSSWTDRAVTTDVGAAGLDSPGRSGSTLTVTVEGYTEGFEIAVLTH